MLEKALMLQEMYPWDGGHTMLVLYLSPCRDHKVVPINAFEQRGAGPVPLNNQGRPPIYLGRIPRPMFLSS